MTYTVTTFIVITDYKSVAYSSKLQLGTETEHARHHEGRVNNHKLVAWVIHVLGKF